MTPLIDGDILLHEIGWSSEFKDKETGDLVLFEFDFVKDLLDKKIESISYHTFATKDPIIFLTDDPFLNKTASRLREVPEYTKGIRYEIAKSHPYKGTRKNPKPFHFRNLQVHFLSCYNTRVAYNGLEADDLITQTQVEMNEAGEETTICSRDKDLRIAPGWHYSWECGNQKAIGPTLTDRLGYMDWSKGLGYGLSFFYYQMLVGDAVDNIPGLPGCGKAGAKKLLQDCSTEEEIFKTVKQAYIDKVGLCLAKDYFLEQANLLWMRMYNKPYEIPKFGG